MKLEVVDLNQPLIDKVINNIHKSQLPYHEYSFISETQLKKYFKNKLINQLNDDDSFAFAVINQNVISGAIVCEKNHFDSEFFGFACYRITDLLVFSSDLPVVIEIVNSLVLKLESKLFTKTIPYYVSMSLNNNCYNFGPIFNSLIYNKYYYIHTLLTFGANGEKFEARNYYDKEDLTIRHANERDVNQVAKLAQTSFKYSRFHMDPFLDDVKAGLLLKRSAENSILSKFVDIMFVAEIKGTVVGYYSAKKKYIPEFEKTFGDVIISAVDSEYRGLGIFSKLDANLLNWFADHTDFSEMGTYLINFPIHKAWIGKKLSLIRGTHQLSKFIK
jgi:GNAT superfamily N-acetyltransferase